MALLALPGGAGQRLALQIPQLPPDLLQPLPGLGQESPRFSCRSPAAPRCRDIEQDLLGFQVSCESQILYVGSSLSLWVPPIFASQPMVWLTQSDCQSDARHGSSGLHRLPLSTADGLTPSDSNEPCSKSPRVDLLL